MISIKEYAKSRKISYEAARKQIVRYAEELESHIIKSDRTQYLDEYAVEILDEKRQSNPIIILETAKDEELSQLRNEKEVLLIKVATLQEELLNSQKEIKMLHQEKIERLEQKDQEKEDMKNSLSELVETVNQLKQDLEQQKAESEAAIEKLTKKKWWQKIF